MMDDMERGSSPGEAPAQAYYVETPLSLVERVLRPLKQGDCFALFDANGDMGLAPGLPDGVYFRDTRYLSRFEMRFENQRPLLLESVLHDDNAALSVDSTNPDIRPHEEGGLRRDAIAINRTKFLWDDCCYERIGFRNFDGRARAFSIDLLFDADFRDLFEVRGVARAGRGPVSARVAGDTAVEFRYDGLDGAVRKTIIRFSVKPRRLSPRMATLDFELTPSGCASLLVQTICREEPRPDPPPFVAALRNKRRASLATFRRSARLDCSDGLASEILTRSASDLHMLTTQTPTGPYPYAGIPWFSTAFGRDAIITAMETLWLDPGLAAGVLRYLAAHQASEIDPIADAEPGKIMHECRRGEMARTGEVPFGLYYGAVDSTPLFIMLAGMYYERTNDAQLLGELWPAIEKALSWCENFGDRDSDGFIEYFRATEQGLANQGWKDSHDSIFHADGSSAQGPIALCEVQAYWFGALRHAASMTLALGDGERATAFMSKAERLRQRFEDAFWCDEIGAYALALDGDKRPCAVRSSNAGHALFCGIASPERASRVARTLMSADGFSGWGVRTIARGEPRFNPMSYHNGSIWPHDNALVALGFGRYGLRKETVRVAEAVFEAAAYQELRRLPELYCGFLRRSRLGPVRYPVACSPQAWAAGAPSALLAACLGLKISARRNEIRFDDPVLPPQMMDLTVKGLRVGESTVDLDIHRSRNGFSVDVVRMHGDVSVVVVK